MEKEGGGGGTTEIGEYNNKIEKANTYHWG